MDQIASARAAATRHRVVTVLGATGSIGRSTAEILCGAPEHFTVAAVAGGRNPEALARMAIRLRASFAALADPAGYASLKAMLAGTGIQAAAGPDAVVEAALHPSDLVMAAIAGTAGVRPTFAALDAGRTIALANKECLVCAGSAFMRQAERRGTRLPAGRQRAQRDLSGARRRRSRLHRDDDVDGLGRTVPHLDARGHRGRDAGAGAGAPQLGDGVPRSRSIPPGS